MSTTLREKNGRIYVVMASPKLDDPIIIEHWFSLNLKAYQFKRDYGADKIGQQLTPSVPGRFMDEDGLQYGLPQGGKTKAEFVEEVDYPAPKQRGKQLETRYQWGQWWKLTKARGWVEMHG